MERIYVEQFYLFRGRKEEKLTEQEFESILQCDFTDFWFLNSTYSDEFEEFLKLLDDPNDFEKLIDENVEKIFFPDEYRVWSERILNVSLLKPSYKLRAKKFFAENGKNALKFVVRAGAIVAAAAVGANLDLPDFDFDVDVPDVDIPNFDNSYNLSLDSGLDPNITSEDYGTSELTNEASNSNISFGSSRESLERELRDANHNMEYYERQIDNFNDSMSSTYRQTCLNGYDDAAKKAKEIADKLSRLQS